MPVSVAYNSSLTTVETLATNATHQSGSVTAQLATSLAAQTSASTPACTARAGADVALSSGTHTIDLTALTGTNGAAVDGTGLRVQYAKFLNPATNANPITIAEGGTNGYDGFGASFSITLVPGAEVLIRTKDAGSDISSTKKTLDLTGTGVQALSYEIIMG